MTRLAPAALAILATTSVARAGDGLPHPSPYIGLYGGYNLVVGDWDIDDANVIRRPADSPLFGLRLGFQIAHWLGIEIGAAVVPFDTDQEGASGVALHWIGDLVLAPFDSAWGPHVVLGGGAYQLASGDLGEDADWDVHAGLGLRGKVLDWLVLRAEARYNLTDSFTSGLAGVMDITLGLDFYTNPNPTPDVDTDADGLEDDDDLCPTEAGPESAEGCPDADGDGLKDADDACPASPGPHKQRGCPDSDKDGVPDDLDRCVTVKGEVAFAGCPPAPPDRDADGVPDPDDQCPLDMGPVQTRGCPDHDGDGVVDTNDKCPLQPGVPEEQGCLPKAVADRFSGAVKGINFQTGAATILKTSFRLLDDAARLFAQFPSLRVEISGHTDDQGPDDANLALSTQRAEAVKAYLVAKGVAPERLVAVGFGETKPVASNKTGAGRAKNRRIEFKILGAY